jgi:hypothetical protein
MSRGNYYYARGWVGNNQNNWGSGGIGRLDDYGDGLVTSLVLLIIGVLLHAFSAFADVHWLAATLPLFSLVFVIAGVISMFSIPEKGVWYVGGWTIVSIVLFGYGLVGGWEFLSDLIPLALVILYMLNEIGVFSNISNSGYSI